jgi:hypothetical protein
MKLKFYITILFAVLSIVSFAQTVSCGVINGSPFCPGTSLQVPYTITGSFNEDNVFTAQISDAVGSFTAPINIGNAVADEAGIVSAQLPFPLAVGTGYRIRVVSSSPVTTGADNGVNISVTASNTPNTNHTKTWIGGSGAWNNPSNWSPCGVPNEASGIVMGANAMVTIPTGFTANIRQVQMTNGAKLTVEAGAVLTCNGTSTYGIELNMAGTNLTNNGTIHCGNIAPITLGGIYLLTGSELVNNTNAIITINDITDNTGFGGEAFFVRGGSSFTNYGLLQIGNDKAVNRSGITTLDGQIINASTGVIDVDRLTTREALGSYGNGTFTNNGSIKIGSLAPINYIGLILSGTGHFTNNANASITINNILGNNGAQGTAIYVSSSGSNFTNAGNLRIGNNKAISQTGIRIERGKLHNLSTGLIEIDSIVNSNAIYTDGAAIITNDGMINIGSKGPIGKIGISLIGTTKLINNALATITVNDILYSGESTFGLYVSQSADFTNAGNIFIGNTKAINHSGIGFFGGQITNTVTGVIEIDRITNSNAVSANGTGNFYNDGICKIGGIAPIASVGISMAGSMQFVNKAGALLEINNIDGFDGISGNSATGSITNNGTIKIGNKGPVKRIGIGLFNGFTLTNNTGGLIEIDSIVGATNSGRGISLNSSSKFINGGVLNIGSTTSINLSCISLSTGQFTNQSTGVVMLNRTRLLDGISGSSTGTFTNAGSVQIGNLAAIGQSGVSLGGGFKFINQANALVAVNNLPVSPAVYIAGNGTSFTNTGAVNIGNLTSIRNGLVLISAGQFTNNQNALVSMDNITGDSSSSVIVSGSGSLFTNAGNLQIGKTTSFERRGIEILLGGQFINQATGLTDLRSFSLYPSDFRAIYLDGNATILSNAGAIKVLLNKLITPTQVFELAGNSSYAGLPLSTLEILVNE